MAVSLSRILPDGVSAEGGTKLVIEGDFSGKLGVPFRVFIGPNGDNTDTPCYSGKVGQGTIIYPLTEEEMWCFLPALETTDGSPFDVYVENVDTPSDNGVLAGPLSVLPRQYLTKVFGLRSVFPRFYRMGPRNIGAVERVS